MISVQNLIKDLCKQIDKTQGQIVGTEKWVLVWEMTKIPFCMILCKNLKD